MSLHTFDHTSDLSVHTDLPARLNLLLSFCFSPADQCINLSHSEASPLFRCFPLNHCQVPSSGFPRPFPFLLLPFMYLLFHTRHASCIDFKCLAGFLLSHLSVESTPISLHVCFNTCSGLLFLPSSSTWTHTALQLYPPP